MSLEKADGGRWTSLESRQMAAFNIRRRCLPVVGIFGLTVAARGFGAGLAIGVRGLAGSARPDRARNVFLSYRGLVFMMLLRDRESSCEFDANTSIVPREDVS
jgi:hypothetical protein